MCSRHKNVYFSIQEYNNISTIINTYRCKKFGPYLTPGPWYPTPEYISFTTFTSVLSDPKITRLSWVFWQLFGPGALDSGPLALIWHHICRLKREDANILFATLLIYQTIGFQRKNICSVIIIRHLKNCHSNF